MVMLHLFFLLLLLIKLKLNKLKLLFVHSLVFDCLALKSLVLFFQLTDNLFQLLDSLAILSAFTCSLFVSGFDFTIKHCLELLVSIS